MWRESYEDEKFIENVDKMWSQVEPLYNELHTYVKRKLEKLYGDKMDKKSDLIPAHLLGNMWAQSWVNLYDRTKPYDDGSLIDVTDKLKENWSVIQMFEESDRFYKDLGLEPNDMSYNETLGAVVHKPTDRVITCHASAWDFCDKIDFRVKMCTNIDQEDFVTVS
jgi:peptidyl-dipeptidase A